MLSQRGEMGQGCGCHCGCGGGGHGGGGHGGGRGRRQGALAERGSLEDYQRDLEQELANVLDRLNQLRANAT
jgi:hypothetical protein